MAEVNPAPVLKELSLSPDLEDLENLDFSLPFNIINGPAKGVATAQKAVATGIFKNDDNIRNSSPYAIRNLSIRGLRNLSREIFFFFFDPVTQLNTNISR